MAGISFQNPGSRLTTGNRYAQMLMRQGNVNNGTTTGGLAHVLRQGLAGYMMGDERRKEEKYRSAMTAALKFMLPPSASAPVPPVNAVSTPNLTPSGDMFDTVGPPNNAGPLPDSLTNAEQAQVGRLSAEADAMWNNGPSNMPQVSPGPAEPIIDESGAIPGVSNTLQAAPPQNAGPQISPQIAQMALALADAGNAEAAIQLVMQERARVQGLADQMDLFKWQEDNRYRPPVATYETVQNPFGRGGSAQRNNVTGQFSNYQGPPPTPDLVKVVGPDGKPMFVPKADAQNQTPWTTPTKPSDFDNWSSANPGKNFNDFLAAEQARKVAVAEATAGSRPLTEGQSNAGTFALRMDGANDALKRVSAGPDGVLGTPDDYDPTNALDNAAAGAGSLGNVAMTPEGRQYQQAKQDWVTANLRKESGAAIGVDEMAKDIKKFFPVYGDDEKTIRQKEAARVRAEVAMRVSSGRAYDEMKGALAKEVGTIKRPQSVSQELWDVMSAQEKAAFR